MRRIVRAIKNWSRQQDRQEHMARLANMTDELQLVRIESALAAHGYTVTEQHPTLAELVVDLLNDQLDREELLKDTQIKLAELQVPPIWLDGERQEPTPGSSVHAFVAGRPDGAWANR